MSEHMSSHNPLLLLILMGEDKSERKVATTRFFGGKKKRRSVFWLQSAEAEVNKQKQISSLNAISAVFTEQSLFLPKQSSS